MIREQTRMSTTKLVLSPATSAAPSGATNATDDPLRALGLQVWTHSAVIKLLLQNDKAVERAIIAIYKRQTLDEQQTESTNHQNGRGYNHADAYPFSLLAKQLGWRQHLSPRDIQWARPRILKYCKQLAEIANSQQPQQIRQEKLL